MDIPDSNITYFIGNLFWPILFLQKVPEFILQMIFVGFHGFDGYFFCALLTTLTSTAIISWMKYQLYPIDANHKFHIQRTAFLMEISSPEINDNATCYLLQPDALRRAIADILGISETSHLVEFPLFEAIRLHTPCDSPDEQKVAKCYGLKVYMAINSRFMSRRQILMKLETAQKSKLMAKALMKVWTLTREPIIDDIVMVYDLGGDLVIQRYFQWICACFPFCGDLRACFHSEFVSVPTRCWFGAPETIHFFFVFSVHPF